jgi:hypothetical protein
VDRAVRSEARHPLGMTAPRYPTDTPRSWRHRNRRTPEPSRLRTALLLLAFAGIAALVLVSVVPDLLRKRLAPTRERPANRARNLRLR